MKKLMRGKVYDHIPGFLSTDETARRLGVSKQAFYKSGLAQVLDRYQQGKGGATYYKETDVDEMARWLFVRQGLIALGLRRGTYPKAPMEEEYRAALAGKWDAACPVCGGKAVRDPDTGRIWCPEHGIVEQPEMAREAKNEQ